MKTRLLVLNIFVCLIALIVLSLINRSHAAGFTPRSPNDWNGTAVRRILHTSAYGGFASDSQILIWAGMPPNTAIAEMLTFDSINNKLSPPQDTTVQQGTDLGSLQAYLVVKSGN